MLFTGKGGVGKTTSAAATAVAAARAGIETLVMSTDAAHSLGDALDRDLGGVGGVPVDIEPHLAALQVSGRRHFDGSWDVVQGYMVDTLGALGVDPLVAQELTSLPGAEEIAALLELRGQAEAGRWQLIVVDCAPTAETLRLLAFPESLAWHLRRMLPGSAGIRRAARPAAAAALGFPLPGPEIIDIVRRWHDDMVAVHRLLSGDLASVRLVTTPESVVIAESRRTWTSLSLYGYAVDAVYVNKILPAPSPQAEGSGESASFLRSWNQAQARGISEVADSFAGLPLVRSAYLTREPIGPDALAGLAENLELGELAGADPLAPMASSPMEVHRTSQGFELALRLPLTSANEVGLQRRGDELILSVGEHRRIVSLPAVLTRCRVAGARVRSGRLTIAFVPDPDQWPEALLAAQAPGSARRTPGSEAK